MRILLLGLVLMTLFSCGPRQEMNNKDYINAVQRSTSRIFNDQMSRYYFLDIRYDIEAVWMDPDAKVAAWMETEIFKIFSMNLQKSWDTYYQMQSKMMEDTAAVGVWSPQKEDLSKYRLNDNHLGDMYQAIRSVENELRASSMALLDTLIKAKRERNPSNPEVLDRLMEVRLKNQQRYLLDTTISQQQWINRYWKNKSLEDMGTHVNILQRNFNVWKCGILQDFKKYFNHRDFIREDFYIDRLAVHLSDAEHPDSIVLNANLARYPRELGAFYLMNEDKTDTIPTKNDGSFGFNQALIKRSEEEDDLMAYGRFGRNKLTGRFYSINFLPSIDDLYKYGCDE